MSYYKALIHLSSSFMVTEVVLYYESSCIAFIAYNESPRNTKIKMTNIKAVLFDTQGNQIDIHREVALQVRPDQVKNMVHVITPWFKKTMPLKNLSYLGNDSARAILVGDNIRRDPILIFDIKENADEWDIRRLMQDLSARGVPRGVYEKPLADEADLRRLQSRRLEDLQESKQRQLKEKVQKEQFKKTEGELAGCLGFIIILIAILIVIPKQ